MPEMRSYDEGGRGHVVRPRWTWTALVLLLVGAAIIGWGLIVMSWTPTLIGIVVFLLGAVAAVYGGLLYDVHSNPSLGAELHDIVHDEKHIGPDPGVTRTPDEVHHQLRRRRRQHGKRRLT